MKWEDEDSSDMQECNIELKSLRRHYPDQVRSQNSWVSSQPAVYGKHPISKTKLKLIYDLLFIFVQLLKKECPFRENQQLKNNFRI